MESSGPPACQEVSQRSGDTNFTRGSYQATCSQGWLFRESCGGNRFGLEKIHSMPLPGKMI